MKAEENEALQKANDLVRNEIERVNAIHGNFNSLHELHGVLNEEVAELFDEIRKKDVDFLSVANELEQISAVAQRALAQIIAGELVK